MRYAVLSDIHANLEALDAVLGDLGQVDATLCLGDLVGYGPDPNACIERVRALPDLACVAGNHDLAALGRYDVSWFNLHAREAVLWSGEQLNDDNRDFLDGLPLTQAVGPFTLVHGSLPEPMDYLLSQWEARLTFEQMTTPVCLVGHTHIAEFYYQPDGTSIPEHRSLINGGKVKLEDGMRYIVNCGGIGQPRDGNPLAAYGLYDSRRRTITVRRVEYDIAAVQRKMRQADLPPLLIDRLTYGR